ncbi:MAG: pentapeptide repeat-containing protein [Gammaproteobacteria bacterium]|nr:pentapeptide repeat-containing protein [Gammaproteobacteria bacterium]
MCPNDKRGEIHGLYFVCRQQNQFRTQNYPHVTVVGISCMIEFIISESGSAIIRNLGLVIAAFLALPLALWRSVISNRQSRTALRQVLDGRFHEAVEMLSHSDNQAVRLGGIYSLARLAKEHPKEFHLQVMEVFSAYITNGKPTSSNTENERFLENPQESDRDCIGLKSSNWPNENTVTHKKSYSTVLSKEVKLIMRIIAKRSESQIAVESKKNFKVNLKGAFLVGLELQYSNFSNINFQEVDLSHANLLGVSFDGSTLQECDLSEARLIADFRGASLFSANFRSTDFSGTLMSSRYSSSAPKSLWRKKFSSSFFDVSLLEVNFHDANLTGVNMRNARFSSMVRLEGTNLSCTDLTNVAGLTQDRLDKAVADPKNPPCLEKVFDSETGKHLMWNGQPLK